MNVQETARKALDILDREGWIQGSAGPSGRCMGGAWAEALTGDQWSLYRGADVKPLTEAIMAQYPGTTGRAAPAYDLVTRWNDVIGRTEDDVRAILEKLAAG
jgi:hypothetical protein